MIVLKHVALIVAANAAGFFLISLGYNAGAALGLAANLDAETARLFFRGATVTWMICAPFSLAYAWIEDWTRHVFLAAPVLLPLGYGLRFFLLSSP